MISPAYEYRIVTAGGSQHESEAFTGYAPDHRHAEYRRGHFDARYPHCAPHRIERRLIGEWEPYEPEQENG